MPGSILRFFQPHSRWPPCLLALAFRPPGLVPPRGLPTCCLAPCCALSPVHPWAGLLGCPAGLPGALKILHMCVSASLVQRAGDAGTGKRAPPDLPSSFSCHMCFHALLSCCIWVWHSAWGLSAIWK